MKKIVCFMLLISLVISIVIVPYPIMAADTTSPYVVSTSPVNNQTNVSTLPQINLSFNEAIKAGKNIEAIRFMEGNVPFTTSVLVKIEQKELIIFPKKNLKENTKYTVIVSKDTVTDMAGNKLKTDFQLTFNTLQSNVNHPAPQSPMQKTFDYKKLMPSVKGLKQDTAMAALKKVNVSKIDIYTKYDEYAPAGTVIDQNYPAGVPTRHGFSYSITVSGGPNPENHNEIVRFCEKKGWTDTLQPMVIAAIKFLIGNTALTKQEIFDRLDRNVEKIYIAKDGEEMGNSGGKYSQNCIVLNRYFYNEKILIHEMVHALSLDMQKQKFGFSSNKVISDEYINSLVYTGINEGVTDWIATRSLDIAHRGFSNLVEDEKMVIHHYEVLSQAYSMQSAFIAPVIHLMGNANFEKLFFADEDKYIKMVQEFDGKYGKSTWQFLIGKAAQLSDYHDPADKVTLCKQYYDKIMDCLDKDLIACGNDKEKLIAFSEKLMEIQASIPLEFEDYRDTFYALRSKLNVKLAAVKANKYIIQEAAIPLPEYENMDHDSLERWLRAYRNIRQMDVYEGYSDTIPYGKVISVNFSGKDSVKRCSILVSKGPEVPSEYIRIPDFSYSYGNIIMENNLEKSYICSSLRKLGLNPIIQTITPVQGHEPVYTGVLGLYPQEGEYAKKGSDIIIKVLMSEK